MWQGGRKTLRDGTVPQLGRAGATTTLRLLVAAAGPLSDTWEGRGSVEGPPTRNQERA